MAKKREDLSGNRYGRLTVLKFSHMSGKHSYWECRCDCGNIKIARIDCLKTGTVRSCGCLVIDNHVKKHGFARSRLYRIYHAMKQRCYNPKSTAYQRYGGRGIRICEEWLNDFEVFAKWALNNGYKDNLTIDRKDFNKDYTPNNCRWITQKEQTRNTSRNTWITINGKTKILKDWCNIYGINVATACNRLKRGLSIDNVFKINEQSVTTIPKGSRMPIGTVSEAENLEDIV